MLRQQKWKMAETASKENAQSAEPKCSKSERCKSFRVFSFSFSFLIPCAQVNRYGNQQHSAKTQRFLNLYGWKSECAWYASWRWTFRKSGSQRNWTNYQQTEERIWTAVNSINSSESLFSSSYLRQSELAASPLSGIIALRTEKHEDSHGTRSWS